MTDESDKPDTNGRDKRGRFGRGNAGGPGRPASRQLMTFREAFRSAVTADDIKEAAKKLVAAARAGSLEACRELFDRTIGRPGPAEYSAELEAIAAEIEQLKKDAKHGK